MPRDSSVTKARAIAPRYSCRLPRSVGSRSNRSKRSKRCFRTNQVVTKILDASTFYPIKGDESYHQDYYKKSPLRYRFYRFNCGRDAHLKEIWGERATH